MNKSQHFWLKSSRLLSEPKFLIRNASGSWRVILYSVRMV